jgi:hypothetical protein
MIMGWKLCQMSVSWMGWVRVGDGVHKLQKQMHSRKSSFSDLCKQTSKREKLELDLDDKNRQLIVEEAREKGDVSLNVYWSYIT